MNNTSDAGNGGNAAGPAPKRQRQEGTSTPESDQQNGPNAIVRNKEEPAESAPVPVPIKWRDPMNQPMLGAASRSWKLPDVGPSQLNIASSWEAAMANDFKPKPMMESPEVPGEITNTGYDDTMSTLYPQSVADTNMSPSNATIVSKSTASSSTNTNTFGSQPPLQPQQPTNNAFMNQQQPSQPQQPMSVIPSAPTTAPPISSTERNTIPKAALYTYYGKKPRRTQIGNDDYFSWNNGGKPHEIKYTAIFQCPITGECFPSGRWGESNTYISRTIRNGRGEDAEMIWFSKKTTAEHAAAAKCYDCLMYRQALQDGQDPKSLVMHRLSTDDPYTLPNAPPLPPVPADVERKISDNMMRIKQAKGACST